jgi:hypothetical protein
MDGLPMPLTNGPEQRLDRWRSTPGGLLLYAGVKRIQERGFNDEGKLAREFLPFDPRARES